MSSSLIPIERIEQTILLIRGQKVILDADIAELYGVETKALKRAVKRNLDRFPADFMFQLTNQEFTNLRYQFGTSSLTGKWGGLRYPPYAFTVNHLLHHLVCNQGHLHRCNQAPNPTTNPNQHPVKDQTPHGQGYDPGALRFFWR
ncbi:ORF6N domain-containing protein [bacterium]|nr:ORF6N domain-containing protein [bacterium]